MSFDQDHHDEEDDDFVLGSSTADDSDDVTDLERTIIAMEQSHVCAHPKHCHSFQQVNFMLSLRKCAACDGRLQTVVLVGSTDPSKQVVRCVACGVVAHRTCSLTAGRWKGRLCPVNSAQISASSSSGEVSSADHDGDDARDDSGVLVDDGTLVLDGDTTNEETTEHTTLHSRKAAPIQPQPPPATPSMEWTLDGPPQHWAGPQHMGNFVQTITVPSSTDLQDHVGGAGDESQTDEDQVHVTPLHYANHPFASVSRALQENIVAHFRPRERGETKNEKSDGNSHVVGHDSDEEEKKSSTDADLIKALVAENRKPKDDGSGDQASRENPIVKFASGTYQAVRTSVNMPARIGMATVAGGIAGGVAGLAMAGPAGAMAGYQLGKTAGALGVILEGSVSIGVFVASVATASYTANKIQEEIQERRILTMGEDGISRKVLLVRPNIEIDPAWEEICLQAKRNAPKPGGSFLMLGDSQTHDRYRRDSDIIRPSEDEIPTAEKILLLVSRILNDKTALPGHVYRSLIQTFLDRCEQRKAAKSDANQSSSNVSVRGCRDDAHAVIKHVTATFLEVRPGFGSSPTTTELTATAVEGLVFGKLYNLVFEEIVQETVDRDAALCEKIEEFERNSAIVSISEPALHALRMLPSAHSAVDKLDYCVIFLEKISSHFSEGGGGGLCAADSLLKMVCQHVLVAQLDHINAEISFLEEFARDEQLLRGREGYALVTLQAALHFLNMSTDVEKDIFWQDNDEQNVPVTASSPGPAASNPLSATTASLDTSGDSAELIRSP